MKKLDIIYEDKELIVINKSSGVLTVSDGKSNNTMYHKVREYLNKKNQKVFIVHRLDKDTSGVILFAKSEKLKKYLQDNWNEICILREYVGIVEGKPLKERNTLKDYLKESNSLQVYVTKDIKSGNLAITNYEVIKSNSRYSMLKITIETGRKNQIRAQLANIKNPLVGDKKYNSKCNPLNRLGLHANKLIIKIKDRKMIFESPVPANFNNLFD